MDPRDVFIYWERKAEGIVLRVARDYAGRGWSVYRYTPWKTRRQYKIRHHRGFQWSFCYRAMTERLRGHAAKHKLERVTKEELKQAEDLRWPRKPKPMYHNMELAL